MVRDQKKHNQNEKKSCHNGSLQVAYPYSWATDRNKYGVRCSLLYSKLKGPDATHKEVQIMSEYDSECTKVCLPKNLPYPLTVLKLHVKEGDEITKYSPIITYRYYDYEPIPISEQDEEQTDESERKLVKVENVGTFDSTVNGKVTKIHVAVNDEIKDSKAPIVEILEPCSHPIQYGGLCAVCGQPVEEEEENTRAPISMAHGTTDLKVSSKEAENIERSSTDRLLKEEKLSLVVDLDQTVIHVTVDPTVAEWMSDPTNPNYEAVKDVRSFILEEPAITPIGYKGPVLPPTKRWYYVKLRPGLQEFLLKMSKRYEMHIYTMATRQYAESIARIIDPDGIYFGERILSRDESGSLTQKTLKRLFPVDTSMVVVIDDRGDVWNWSPNLIKVVPYDFFLGIGDINSSFLPRQQMLLGPSKRRKSVNILEEQLNNNEESKNDNEDESKIENKKKIKDDNASAKKENNCLEGPIAAEVGKKVETVGAKDGDNDETRASEEHQSSGIDITTASHGAKSCNDVKNVIQKPEDGESSSPVDRLVELSYAGDNSNLLAVQESERTNALEQQEHDRPLAKLQENLDKIIEEEEEEAAIDFDGGANKAKSQAAEYKSLVESKESHNLLFDDDRELEYLGQALVRIHNEFYFEMEKANQENDKSAIPDVKDIMTEMKSIVFQGCVFLLSGVLPLGTPLENADIVIWAKSFGATFVENYNPKVTHVICKNGGTFKVRLAKSVDSNVKIVNPDWLFACMSLWDRISEEPYEVKVDSLLSKAQVDDFLQFHGEDTAFLNSKSLDWGEIDEEMKEFMGSDYEDNDDDDDDEDDEDDNESSKGDAPAKSESMKRPLTDDMPNSKKQKIIEGSNTDDSEDEFERDLLEHLADLE